MPDIHFVKFDSENEKACMCCQYYVTCMRLRKVNCFSFNKALLNDIHEVFEYYFVPLHDKAVEASKF